MLHAIVSLGKYTDRMAFNQLRTVKKRTKTKPNLSAPQFFFLAFSHPEQESRFISFSKRVTFGTGPNLAERIGQHNLSGCIHCGLVTEFQMGNF